MCLKSHKIQRQSQQIKHLTTAWASRWCIGTSLQTASRTIHLVKCPKSISSGIIGLSWLSSTSRLWILTLLASAKSMSYRYTVRSLNSSINKAMQTTSSKSQMEYQAQPSSTRKTNSYACSKILCSLATIRVSFSCIVDWQREFSQVSKDPQKNQFQAPVHLSTTWRCNSFSERHT